MRTRRSASSIENERTADFSDNGCNSWSRVVGDAIRVARTGIARRVESWCGGARNNCVDDDRESGRVRRNIAGSVLMIGRDGPGSIGQPSDRAGERQRRRSTRAVSRRRTITGDDLDRPTGFGNRHGHADCGLLGVVVRVARPGVIHRGEIWLSRGRGSSRVDDNRSVRPEGAHSTWLRKIETRVVAESVRHGSAAQTERTTSDVVEVGGVVA